MLLSEFIYNFIKFIFLINYYYFAKIKITNAFQLCIYIFVFINYYYS